jgi:lysophospholipase L1-like esterase
MQKKSVLSFVKLGLILLMFSTLFSCATFKGEKEEKKCSEGSKWIKHFNTRVALFREENIDILENRDAKWEKQIVMLGDSLTEGFDLKKAFPGKPFVNRGIVADHIDWGTNWDTVDIGVIHRLDKESLAPDPSYIFILIGVNDIGDSTEKIDIYIKNYKKMLKILKKTYPCSEIIIQSGLPCRNKYARLNKGVVEFNTKLEKLARKFKLKYVDLYSIYRDEKGELKENITRDGIHLKPEAYISWQKEIEKILKTEL